MNLLPSDESDMDFDLKLPDSDFDSLLDRESFSPPLPPPRPTTLLDLPTEILLRIGQTLCPLGGRSAAILRLTCSRFARAVAPVVWASIKLPEDAKEAADLFTHLIRHREVLSFITSVTYPLTDNLTLVGIAAAILGTLPSLKRLHIEGHHEPLPDALYDQISRIETLHTLSLARMDLTGRDLYYDWPATTRALALDGCIGAFNLFYSVKTQRYKAFNLSSFTFKPLIPDGWFDTETYAVTCALHLHRHLPRSLDFEVHWGVAVSSEKADTFVALPWKPLAGQSIKLRILGLFAAPDPTEPVKLLNWIGAANLMELSIPLSLALTKHAAIRHLVLPSLETLELTSTRTTPTFSKSDRLNEATYPTLNSFLSATSLPRLTRVLVSGLFDKTSVGKLAGKSIRDLALSHVYLRGLLDVLLDTNLVELRLANSDGHLETNVQCLFEREEGEDKWTPRRVTLW